jgi:hypothetical protein
LWFAIADEADDWICIYPGERRSLGREGNESIETIVPGDPFPEPERENAFTNVSG